MLKTNLWQKMFHPESDPKAIPSLMKKIHRYAEGVDYHLTNLKYVAQDAQELKNLLADLINLKTVAECYKDYNIPYPQEFSRLMNLMNLWPDAVNNRSICKKANDDILDRGSSIIDVFLAKVFLDDLKFLNYGCGEGSINYCAIRENPKINVGFDTVNHWKIPMPPLLLTTNWDEVKENGPYDVILLFDVLDHTEDVQKTLTSLKEVLALDGKIFIRCHPWCSRHGTHLYESGLNKAYAHLILDDVELVRIGNHINKPTIKITNVMKTYRNWFVSNGFNIIDESPTFSDIEQFFYRPELINRINKHWGDGDYFIIPEEDLGIEFVDYELEHIKGIL